MDFSDGATIANELRAIALDQIPFAGGHELADVTAVLDGAGSVVGQFEQLALIFLRKVAFDFVNQLKRAKGLASPADQGDAQQAARRELKLVVYGAVDCVRIAHLAGTLRLARFNCLSNDASGFGNSQLTRLHAQGGSSDKHFCASIPEEDRRSFVRQ